MAGDERVHAKHRFHPLIIALLAVFAAGVVFAGWTVGRRAVERHQERLDAAVTNCRTAASRYAATASAYRATMRVAGELVSQAEAVGLDDSMESFAQVRRLAAQSRQLKVHHISCTASLGADQLDATTSRAAADRSRMVNVTRDIQYGAETLRGVVTAAQSGAGREQLGALIARGRLVLERSNGKTGEDVRRALTQSVDAAQHTLDTTPTTADRSVYNSASHTLQTAIDRVISAMPTDCRLVDCVALTFDDGPNRQITPRVLDALKQGGAQATFFVQGQFVHGSNVALVRRMAQEGHAVGSISWRHTPMHAMPADQVRKWFDDTDTVITQASGQPVTLFRPPDGAWSEPLRAQAQASGQAMILWSVDGEDWKTKRAATVERQVLQHAYAGSIVDLHDGNTYTAAALPGIIAGLKTRGFRLVTVDTLLADDLQPGAVFYGLGDAAESRP